MQLIPQQFSLRLRLATAQGIQGAGHAVPFAIGLILLTAALLKAHQLVTSLVVENSFVTSQGFRIGLIELESALGLWLLLGLYPQHAKWSALACFTVFSVVSLHQALQGKASCSCFGLIALKPWYTFLFDLVAVATLWYWHPKENIGSDSGSVRKSCSYSWHMIAFGIFFLPTGILVSNAVWKKSVATPIIAAPEIIVMGEVPAGGFKEVAFFLTNFDSVPRMVARIETSCHCLNIGLPNYLLAPGEQIMGHARLNLSCEPTFAGSLSVEVKGLDQFGIRLACLLGERGDNASRIDPQR